MGAKWAKKKRQRRKDSTRNLTREAPYPKPTIQVALARAGAAVAAAAPSRVESSRGALNVSADPADEIAIRVV